MGMDQFEKFFRSLKDTDVDAMRADIESSKKRYWSNRGTPKQLSVLAERYLERHDFTPGQLVRWKADLKNVASVEYGKPMVVLEIRPGRRSGLEEKVQNTPYEDLPEDIRVATICPEDGSFDAYWYDSQRLEPYFPGE